MLNSTAVNAISSGLSLPMGGFLTPCTVPRFLGRKYCWHWTRSKWLGPILKGGPPGLWRWHTELSVSKHLSEKKRKPTSNWYKIKVRYDCSHRKELVLGQRSGLSSTFHADSHHVRLAVDGSCTLWNSYTEALTPNVTIFESEAVVWLIRFG